MVRMARDLQSCTEFDPSMLPQGVSLDSMLRAMEILAPTLIVLHGSTVSHKKYSNKKISDLDLICVSIKAAFWPVEQLQRKVKEVFGNLNFAIDLTIVSRNEFLSIIEGKSSLGESLSHGFSILYSEEER